MIVCVRFILDAFIIHQPVCCKLGPYCIQNPTPSRYPSCVMVIHQSLQNWIQANRDCPVVLRNIIKTPLGETKTGVTGNRPR